MLKIARGKNPAKTRLVEYAVKALKFFKRKNVRLLALEKLKTGKNAHVYINLLTSNYQKADYKLLSGIAKRYNNYDYIHSIVFGFIEICETNKTRECKEPLEIIYDKMNCAIHRLDIVRLLIENNVFSNRIQQELKYDSYEEIRKLYSIQKKKGMC